MDRHVLLRIGAACAIGTSIAIAAPAVAQAHVGVDPSDTSPGAYAVLTFAVGHGCDGSPTTSVTFELPEDVGHATPTAHPGWTISSSDDEPQTITYTADEPLPDGVRDTFAIALTLPDGEPGDTVAFPVTQTCEEGQNDWTELPEADGSEPEMPAPIVTLTEAPAVGDDGHDGHGATEASADDAADAAADDGVARLLGGAALVAALLAAVLAAIAVRRAGAPAGSSASD